MNRSSENERVSQSIREYLHPLKIEGKFDYAEAEHVSVYQFTSPAPVPTEFITFGPQIHGRIFERVFWVAPNKSLMDKPKDMETLLDEISTGFYTQNTTAQIRNNRLIYGRREFWTGPNQRCLNIELVALPHKKILEMLQNYYTNKQDLHPVLKIEGKENLAYSVTQEQLRVLKEQEKKMTQPTIGIRGIEAIKRWMAERMRFLKGS